MALEWNVTILQSDWFIFETLDSDWLYAIPPHITTTHTQFQSQRGLDYHSLSLGRTQCSKSE